MAHRDLSRELTLPYVSCPTCRKSLGDKYEEYNALLDQGVPSGEALDRMRIRRICCRTRMISPPQIAEALLYDEFTDRDIEVLDEFVSASTIATSESSVSEWYQIRRTPEIQPGQTRTFIAR